MVDHESMSSFPALSKISWKS